MNIESINTVRSISCKMFVFPPRTMNVHFDSSVLMTLSAWLEDCFIQKERAWTPHIWTNAHQVDFL